MPHYPCIVFDQAAVPLYAYGPDDPSFADSFASSLLRGDRERFSAFCQAPADAEDDTLMLFRLTARGSFSYAYLEKARFGADDVTIAYLAEDVADFYPMLSPNSRLFRRSTGEILAALLCAGYEKSVGIPSLAPTALLLLNQIPHLRDTVFADVDRETACDLRILLTRVVETVGALPTFAKTKLTQDCVFLLDPAEEEGARGVRYCTPTACVYLLTSLLHLFHALAADHRIHLHLSYTEDVSLSITASVAPARAAHPHSLADTSDLSALGLLVPAMTAIAEVAAIVAADAHIDTCLRFDRESGLLETTVMLARQSDIVPAFRYSDPYSGIPALVAEYAAFLATLGLAS